LDEAGIDESVLKTEIIVVSDAGTISSVAETAKKKKADLIVMGSHGKTGIEKFVFGSVTAGVLENSSLPVLVIPRHFRFKPVNKVALASSLTHFTPEIRSVLAITKALGARLEVVHFDDALLSEKLISHARRVLAEIDGQDIDLHVFPINLEEKLADQIRKYVAYSKPDWLVMLPKKREWYEKLFLSSKTLEVAMELTNLCSSFALWLKSGSGNTRVQATILSCSTTGSVHLTSAGKKLKKYVTADSASGPTALS
jgi:nucleotide-binding universal stress UspA family protein